MSDNQTIIVNEGFKTPREIKLEARVKELEKIINRLSKEVNAPYTLDDLISIDKLQRKLEIAETQIRLARDIAYDSCADNPVRVQIDNILTEALQKMKEVKNANIQS